MLAKAFDKEGRETREQLKDNELFMDAEEVEMTDADKMRMKQLRIKCLVLVQTFFAGLGDPREPMLDEYTKESRKIKAVYDVKKKQEAREERERVKREHVARQTLL